MADQVSKVKVLALANPAGGMIIATRDVSTVEGMKGAKIVPFAQPLVWSRAAVFCGSFELSLSDVILSFKKNTDPPATFITDLKDAVMKSSTQQYSLLAFIITGGLIISACSSSNDGNSTPGSGITSYPFRVASIETDFEMDGSTDRVSYFSYDSNGRMTQYVEDYSVELENLGVSDTTADYLYSAGNLVEIKTSGTVELLTYANDRLIGYQRTSPLTEVQKSYEYDDQGRLIRTIGPNGIYDDDDCYFNSLDNLPAEPNAPDLLLSYTNNRLTSINSSNGVLNQTLVYNSAGKVARIEETYTCPDAAASWEATLSITYNSDGRITQLEDEQDGFVDTITVTLDEQGRPLVLTQTDEFDTTTQTYTYNEQGYPATLTSVSSSPSLFFPDYSVTITYEQQSCQVAYSADPLRLATLFALTPSQSDSDPSSCLYPFDRGGF